jgi:pyrroline-5-carboxylate reductase
MTLSNHTIAFIGCGVMGEAMIKGMIGEGLVTHEQIIGSDPYESRVHELTEQYAIRMTTSNVEAVSAADIVVLSVKPQIAGKVLHELRGRVDRCSLILSIIAGVKIATIADHLLNARVVRAMPNTPGQIGQGMTVWMAAPDVQETQRSQARSLLGALGDELYVDEEHFLDMATALSATGPAYVFMFMEALIDAGVHMGFSRRDAERLVLQTMRGSVEYAIESKMHPAQLRNQVTSPGGTSAAALYQLEKGSLRTVISRAVYAAYQRAIQLGSQSDKHRDK